MSVSPSLVLGVPAAVLSLHQEGAIERAFHDGLFPNLSFRAEALKEEWPPHTGTEVFMTRPGLLKPVVRPLVAGSDPVPQQVPYEQWVAKLEQYAGTIDTHAPTSATAAQDLFLRNIHQLGLQAGQSINRLARNKLFQAYCSGRTVMIAAGLAGDTSIRVASLNGFIDVVIPGGNVRPQTVSPSYPSPVVIGTGGAAISRSVIGYLADDPNDLNGPGTLLLNAALGAGFASRTPVISSYAPEVVRAGGGASVDALSDTDTLTLQQCIDAVAKLRTFNVQPHDDGFYHAHIAPGGNAQFFADPVFQRLNQSLPEGAVYKEGFIGTISGIMFFMNNESPDNLNTGDRILTGTNAYYSSDIGAETTNDSGVNVGRVIMTGKGTEYERWMDESSHFVTEAGMNGKQGEFQVVNNGVEVSTENIRLILRAPIDRMQQMVSATWSITTSFAVPSDITAPGGSQRYKRAIVLEYAAS